MNILHITECSSPSSIASFEDCFCLVRTWSFTLCKNVLDPNDNSDSASSSSITNWCARVEPFYLPLIHQMSTLEKTKFHQNSILSGLMSVRKQRVSPFHRTSQLANWKEFDFHIWSSRAFRCNRWNGSPFTASRDQIHHWSRLCCDSFFTWIFLRSFRHHFRTLCRTEMANVKQTQKMIPFITCEVSLCQYVCELVLGVDVFDLDLGIQIDSIEQPIKTRVSSSDFVLWWSSWSQLRYLQNVQLRVTLRRVCVCGNRVVQHGPHATNNLGFPSVWVWMCAPFRDRADSFLLRACFLVICYCSMSVTLLSPHPISPKQVVRPFSIQNPTKYFLIL